MLINDDGDVVPVSSENFELWIRMATDNKINVDNTWNFALIDYFHNFSVLKDGDGVNFQKASATLDGCMKIYSNRVESVVKDTGTLLSTLNINSSNQPQRGNLEIRRNGNNEDGDEEGGDQDNDDDEEDRDFGSTRRANALNRCPQPRKEKGYLVESFDAIMMKASDRPVSVDPIFKKALQDFDEMGARSLLHNILHISNESKIVLDVAKSEKVDQTSKVTPTAVPFDDLNSLVNLDFIDGNTSVCPSLKRLHMVAKGTANPTDIIEELDNVDVTMVEEAIINQHNAMTYNAANGDENPFREHNDDVMRDFDIHMDDQFGYNLSAAPTNNNDGGDDDDDNASISSKRTQYSLFIDEAGDNDHSGIHYTFRSNRNSFSDEYRPGDDFRNDDPLSNNRLNKSDMSYINMYDDIGFRPNVYWKITRYKKMMRSSRINLEVDQNDDEIHNVEEFNEKTATQTRKRPLFTGKKKNKPIVDFLNDDNDISNEVIFTPTDYLSRIMLGERERKSGRHILEGDLTFSAKTLAFLSLKPIQMTTNTALLPRRRKHDERDRENIPAGPDFFAETYKDTKQDILPKDILSDPMEGLPDFDDFDPNGVDGYDVPLQFSPTQTQSQLQSQTQTPTQTQTQHQSPIHTPSQVHRMGGIAYAKRAKKVDVKLLKQNIWTSIEEISTKQKKRPSSVANSTHDRDETPETENTTAAQEGTDVSIVEVEDIAHNGEMRFTKVVEIMSKKYNAQVKSELSTSFCFICLLHLANEQGLVLETQRGYEDLIIHK